MGILLAVAIGIIMGFLKHGRLKGLAEYMHYPTLLVVSLALEASIGMLSKYLPHLFPEYMWVIVIIQYAFIFAFFMLNCEKWPVAIMSVGVLLNFAVIISNGGRMPVSPAVLDIPAYAVTVERITTGAIPEYFIMNHKVALWFLGDIIAIPIPGAGIGSIGDLFMMIGMILFIYLGMTTCRPRHLHTNKSRNSQ